MAKQKSEQAHRRVIAAAASLFAERGIENSSMDAIAADSGVSKATIYRHWPDKDSLCLEVLSYLHGLDEPQPVFDSGDLRQDLIAQLRHDPAADRRAMRERITPALIAYASHNHVFGRAWRSRVIEPARASLIGLMRRGKERGLLKPDLDPEVGLALLLGPIIYRNVVLRKQGSNVPLGLEEAIADTFLAGFGLRK